MVDYYYSVKYESLLYYASLLTKQINFTVLKVLCSDDNLIDLIVKKYELKLEFVELSINEFNLEK